MPVVRSIAVFVCLLSLSARLSGGEDTFELKIKPLLRTYCVGCHGKADEISANVDFTSFNSQTDADASFDVWEAAIELIGEGLMPPADAPQPTSHEKELLGNWYQASFVDSIEAHPGFFRPRRLSAYEYRNTLHSLLGFPLEVVIMEAEQTVAEKSLVMKLLPLDPPGPSGFKNDTSGNPLSTLIWDQYSYLIDSAMESLFSANHRDQLEAFTGQLDGEHPTEAQAIRMLRTMAHRAYRRPVSDVLLDDSFAAIAGKTEQTLEEALIIELKTILMSPPFIYRGLLMDVLRDEQTAVDEYELGERLSYFLWGDMPDQELMRLSQEGRLSDPDVYREQINRMLASPKARNLAEDFAVQWFSLSEIRHVSNNPPVTHALRSQPIDFMNYLFVEGRPLIELIDCDTTFINPHTAKYYPVDRKQMARYKKAKGIEVERVANTKIKLNHTKERGGLLTMPGVLAMNRGPVLRGTWILERVLGQHLPDPPANVGQVAENKAGENLSFRQRFELHRSEPACAACHDKIDPLGFALEVYDSGGGYMKSPDYGSMKAKGKKKNKSELESAVSIDTSGQLPSGETFVDFQELKQILVTQQRERVIRNIVQRMMAYALCRKLEAYDRPAVEAIVKDLHQNHGTFHDLIHRVADSLPFRQTVVKSSSNRGDSIQP